MGMSSKIPALAIVAIALLAVSSQVFMAGGSDRLYNDAEITESGIEWEFSSDYVTHWSAISLDNGDVGRASYYIACYDDDHEWLLSDSHVTMVLGHLRTDLSKYDIPLIVLGADDVLALMAEEVTNEIFNANIIFLTGSLPSEIYDGTPGSPLLVWLTAGGKMTFANAPLGKYVSHEDRVDTVADYSTLFFGQEGVINDSEMNLHDLRDHLDGVGSLFGAYYNECTYGIRPDLVDDCFTTEYEQEGYYALSFSRYHGGSGNMTVFGGTVDNNSTGYMAQVLAAGLNYSTEIIDHEKGLGTGASGTLACAGNPSVFLFFGLVTDFTGKYYDFSVQPLVFPKDQRG